MKVYDIAPIGAVIFGAIGSGLLASHVSYQYDVALQPRDTLRMHQAIQAGGALEVGFMVPKHRCQEDEECWSCVDMGNRVCGPGNSNEVPAGCYDDGGVLVAIWPCHVEVNLAGGSDIYEGNDPDEGVYQAGYSN